MPVTLTLPWFSFCTSPFYTHLVRELFSCVLGDLGIQDAGRGRLHTPAAFGILFGVLVRDIWLTLSFSWEVFGP